MSSTYGCGSKRSGISSGPTNDPDLWSRPPIQTLRELIQTFGMIYIYIIYGRVDVWSNDVTCFLGFPALRLFTLPSSQATNYCKATRSQAATVARPTCQAVKLPSGHCCKARLPSSQAVHLLPAHLVFLFLSPSIQAATYTKTYIGPIL